jgi:hypothetical protein
MTHGHPAAGLAPSRVFLSHTSELRAHPRDQSFVAAAEDAVLRAGHAVTDMAYFTASDSEAADYCTRMIAIADIYVGIIGVRYGAKPRGRPDRSHTELEFETATALGLTRLVFLVHEDAPSLPRSRQSADHRGRQNAFRGRLEDAGVTVAWVRSPAELELKLYQALAELRIESARVASDRTHDPERCGTPAWRTRVASSSIPRDRNRPRAHASRLLEGSMEKPSDVVDAVLSMTGWTQARLAHELRRTARSLGETEPIGLDAVTVNRWRRGRQTPGAYYQRLLRHLYASTCEQQSSEIALWQKVAGGRLRRPDDVVTDMNRREILRRMVAAAGIALFDIERLCGVLRADAQPDERLLDNLEALTRVYSRRWHSASLSELVPVVRNHVAILNELRLRSSPPSIQLRIGRLAAATTALMGWLVWLMGDRETAEAYCAFAQGMARDFSDDNVLGFILVARSFMYSRLFGAGPGTSSVALTLLDEGVRIARSTSSPFLNIFALNRRAEELALRNRGGDARATWEDLERAEFILAAATGKDRGFFEYLDEPRLAGARGSCATHLGQVDDAITILSQVVEATPRSLAAERSILLTDLGSAFAQSSEVEVACELLGQSLALGRSGDVNRVERVVAVRRDRLARWSDVPAVRRLDEQLRAQLTS